MAKTIEDLMMQPFQLPLAARPGRIPLRGPLSKTMTMITLIGVVAATCTTMSFVPQVAQILKTGNVSGISLSMYGILTTGVGLWMLYGFLISDVAVFVANLITFILAVAVMALTIRERLFVSRGMNLAE
ncbi:SemiSWEET transporter [Reinekea sp.]|jgi:MtN3 and saliva related transmembrane protein|uniref:SemiSWEET family sugar transporter n=1 Tax=Reinekea sp. TaxID=1970455 RepID=UPI002A802B11|nr:SemiSWEET transporter [Reinekea sp.]